MKQLNNVIIMILIQLLAVLAQEASTSTKTNSFKDKLLKFYGNELQLLSKEFCDKAKVLSENLLQDETIQQSSDPNIKEFKNDITDFLYSYPAYKNYDLDAELVLQFENIIEKFRNFNNNPYIKNLLETQGYFKINDDYETKWQTFVKQKFLPKFVELKTQLSAEELEQHQDLLQYYQDLKQCQNYNCIYRLLNNLIRNPKEQLFEYIREELLYLNIFYGNNAYDIVKNVLQNPKLSQLSPDVKQNLTHIINDFIHKFESNQDVEQLNHIIQIFYNSIILKFYYNKAIPLKDQQLLLNIFEDQGYAKFNLNSENKFNDFVEQGLFKQFEQFKKSLNTTDSAREEPLLQWFEQFKTLTSYKDRVAAFGKLYKINLKIKEN